MRVGKIKEMRKETAASWSIIAAVAIMIGVCCLLCPWLDDDIIYQYNCRWENINDIVPIRTIGDIFESQYYHYFNTNGRFVAHWIVQLFDGILGQTAFAVANAIVYILFIRMIMATCGIRMTNWQGVLTTACLVITCQCLRMTPAFQMYIWMYLLVLCYLWILLHYHTKKWWMLVLLCVFSLICGNAHESLNPGIVVGVGLYFCLNYRKISLQQWLMYGFFCLGLIILLASPATRVRMDDTVSTMEYRVLALYSMRKAIPAFYILAAIVLYKTIFKKEKLREIIHIDTLWWGIWATCFGLLLYFGFSGGRAALGEELAAIILILKLLKGKRFTPFWLSIFTIATVAFAGFQMHKIFELRTYLYEIKKQTLTNPDGNIYIDFSYSPPIGGLEQYAGQIRNVNFHELADEARMMALVSDCYTKKWGVNHDIRLYPTALRPYIEGKADTTDGNILAEIAPGSYLIVLNKKNPAKFHVNYTRDIPFFEKEFPPKDVDVTPGIYESAQWRAMIVTSYFYHPLYPATFSMTKPEIPNGAASGAN